MQAELALREIDGRDTIVVQRPGREDEKVALVKPNIGLLIAPWFDIEFEPDQLSFSVFEKDDHKLIGQVQITGKFQGREPHPTDQEMLCIFATIQTVKIVNAP